MSLSYQLKQSISQRTRIRIPEFKNAPLLCQRMEQRIRLLSGVVHVEVRPKSGSVILLHPKGRISLETLLSDMRDEFTVYLSSPEGSSEKGRVHNNGHVRPFDTTSHECPGTGNGQGFHINAHGLPPTTNNESLDMPLAINSFQINGSDHPANATPATSPAGKACSSRYHVSGKTLVISGLYIFYLMVRRVFLPIPPLTNWMDRMVSLPFVAAFGLTIPIQRQAVDNYKTTGKVDMGMISTALVYMALFTGNIVSALVVTWLFNFSGWMETRIKKRTRQTVREMLTGKVTHAWKVVDGTEVEVAVTELVPGDIITLNQGDLLPVDGVVVSGDALIDESAMTGEGIPLTKHPESEVLAGTMIVEGGIHVRVEKSGEKTRLAAIIRLIESAETDTGELGRLSLRLSQAMVPVSLLIAAVTFLITGNFLQAMTVIMITCPCALRLSTAVAVSVAMGNAASQGILIKGGFYVEMAGRVDLLIVDKTGTLTRSMSTMVAIEPVDKRYKEKTILKLAASLLNTSRHPLGHAVVQAAHEQSIPLIPCDNREMMMGKGAKGLVGKQTLVVGSRRLMEEHAVVGLDHRAGHRGGDGIDVVDDTNGINSTDGINEGKRPAKDSTEETYRDASVVFVAADARLIGRIRVGNTIREDATNETLARIRQAGVNHIVMLSGDTRSGCAELKKRLAFDEVHWGMTPEGKADWIADRRATHPDERIAVVGDGINDTPAFARSDLSFAVGEGGIDVTMKMADIVLQQGGIGQVATTLEVGRETLDTIRQSYTIAIGFNAVTLLMMTLGIVSPLAGALLHNLTTVYAVGNAAKSAGDAHQTIQTQSRVEAFFEAEPQNIKE